MREVDGGEELEVPGIPHQPGATTAPTHNKRFIIAEKDHLLWEVN